MLPFEDRYTRQRRLPEVGREGQERIARTVMRVTAGEGSLYEAIYLERAGVRSLHIGTGLRPEFAHASSFEHELTRGYAAGCWAAVGQLRRALGLDAETESAPEVER